MQCPHCNAQLEDDTVFCGNCGKQIAPLQAKGTMAAYKAGGGEDGLATVNAGRPGTQSAMPQTPTRNYVSRPDTPDHEETPPLPVPPQPAARKSNTLRVAFISVMVLLIIGIATLGTVALLNKNNQPSTRNMANNTSIASTATGTISFSDSQTGSGHSNVATLEASGLTAPPAGSQYYAWVVNTKSEYTTGLGTLTQNEDGTFTTKFPGDQNVLSLGNRVEVTLEQSTVTVPTGQILLSSIFPPKAFIHIKHLLVSFPDTPGKIGLLVGLIDQTKKLSSASTLLQRIANSGKTSAIQCASQSIIDIAEGSQGSHYRPMGNQCATLNITDSGDGYGLLGSGGYIANGKAHASLAATQSDTTISIRVHAGHVAMSLENMRDWITTLDQDAISLLNKPTSAIKVQEIVTFANHALNGVDTNGDGSIDPVPGEGGSVTAYFHGQLMAALVLAPDP